jgi:NAD(P)-dependent dehydrogenase (short-subunit alcohol dehydrogenase family)
MGRVQDKITIVTGGASEIGTACAALAREGWRNTPIDPHQVARAGVQIGANDPRVIRLGERRNRFVDRSAYRSDR